MTRIFGWCLAAAAIFAPARALDAGVAAVDLNSLANEPWTFVGPNDFLIINGSSFPVGPLNLGGIPFAIPSGPDNYWGAAAAANFGSGTVSLTIPIGVYGVSSVFTVLNTMWGWAGPAAYIYVTFTGSEGAAYTVPLVGNVNVRDYNQDGNTNTINNTSTIQVWQNGEGQRLDRQEYILPAVFAKQVLSSITITDTGNEGNGVNGSRTVLAGLSVSTCRAYAAETLSVSSGDIAYDASLRLYYQNVSLTNTGSAAVYGPLFYILENLAEGVKLASKAGETGCFPPAGSPYAVPLLYGASLAPNTTLNFRLWFSDPAGAGISYTPLLAGSLGGLP